MRNLKYYTGDSFAFYETVLSKIKRRKNDPGFKNRIGLHEPIIEKLFLDFDSKFLTNSLETIISHGYNKSVSNDLNSLYAYRNETFQKLKDIVTTSTTGRSVKVCQCCTIGEVNAFDHILPQKAFAEYSVHPRNLFPICAKCNGHKNDVTSSEKIFLNLYLDKLPTVQYLFARLDIISESKIDVKFYIDNRNGIDLKTFQLIKSHYRKLYLCERFSEHRDDVISDLVDDIESNLDELPLELAISIAKIKIKKDKVAFGHNFWQSVLQEALIDSDQFMARFAKSTP